MSALLTHTAINKLEGSIKEMQKTLENLKYDDNIKKEIEELLYKITATPQKSLIIQMNTVNNIVKPEDWNKEGELTDYFYHVDWIEEPGVYKVVAFEDVYNEDNEGVLIISKTTDENIVTITQNLFLGETIMVRKGTIEIPENACPDFHNCPEWGEWSEISAGGSSEGGKSYTEIEWNETSKLSDFIEPGIYICNNTKRYTLEDELPITNVWSEDNDTAYISFTLIVNKAVHFKNTPNEYEGIGQTLILTNRAGNETKQYIRTLEHDFNSAVGEWGNVKIIQPWNELKGTFNLNMVSDDDLKECTQNGTYEGAINNNDISSLMSDLANSILNFIFLSNSSGNSLHKFDGGAPKLLTGSLFTMEVKNNYALVEFAKSQGISVPRSVTQTAKIQLIDGTYMELSRIKRDNVSGFPSLNDGNWTNWYMNIAFHTMLADFNG